MTGMNQNPVIIVQFYSNLNALREAGEYIDVLIRCGDRDFKCHKLALAIASDYFRAMFAGNFKESTDTHVPLHEIKAETFEHILHFIYSGHIVINSHNVCNLLWASDFLRIQSIKNLCIEFVQEMKATFKNIVDIFAFAQATNKSDLLKKIETLYFVPHFTFFSKMGKFLELTFEYLTRIMEQYLMTQPKNDTTYATLLSVILPWIFHEREARLPYLKGFFNIIQQNNIPCQVIELKVEEIITSNPPPLSRSMITLLQPELSMQKTFLHFCVEFTNNKIMRIYSINYKGHCNQNRVVDASPISHRYQHITVKDLYLYRLQFVTGETRAKNLVHIDEHFSVTTSVKSSSWLKLSPPPVEISSWPQLCNIQNNIYLYECNPKRRIDVPTSNRMFTDDEFYHSIYCYNCDLDRWLPVPLMGKKLCHSYLCAYHDILYLVGQGRYPGSIPERLYAQVYDSRMGNWNELPASNIKVEPDTYVHSCCTLNRNIYLVHCNDKTRKWKMTRYDTVSAKWEVININTADLFVHFPIVTPYLEKMWLTEAVDSHYYNLDTGLITAIYDPVKNALSPSLALMNATAEERCKIDYGVRLNIVDRFVFKN